MTNRQSGRTSEETCSSRAGYVCGQEAEQALLVFCVCPHEWKCLGSTAKVARLDCTTHIPRA